MNKFRPLGASRLRLLAQSLGVCILLVSPAFAGPGGPGGDPPRLASLVLKSGSGLTGFANVTLDPPFQSDNVTYTITIPFEHNEVAVDTLNTLPVEGTVEFNVPEEIPAGGSAQVTVSAVVGGLDGSEQTDYTITVFRDAPDNSSALSSLVVSGTALSPSFLSDFLNYNATVANGVTSITITPTVITPNATVAVRIDGFDVPVKSGKASPSITLAEGVTSIPVLVTAPGTSNVRPYTIDINRLAADGDGDGMPDVYELANGLAVASNDAELDLDGDGLRNIAEYAFGSDPDDFSDHNAPLVTRNAGGFLVITFNRAIPPGQGFSYEVQMSSNLADWSNDTVDLTNSGTPDTQVWRDNFGGAPTAPATRFIRVKFISSL